MMENVAAMEFGIFIFKVSEIYLVDDSGKVTIVYFG